jgi:hypothetical protein
LHDVPLAQPNPSPTSGHLDNVTNEMWPTISNLMDATFRLINSQREIQNLQERIKGALHKKNTVLPNNMETVIQETIKNHTNIMKKVQKAHHALITNKSARLKGIAQTENAYKRFMILNNLAATHIDNPEKLKKIHSEMKDTYIRINELVAAPTFNRLNYVDRANSSTTFTKKELEAKLRNIERTLTAPKKTGGAPPRGAKKTAA